MKKGGGTPKRRPCDAKRGPDNTYNDNDNDNEARVDLARICGRRGEEREREKESQRRKGRAKKREKGMENERERGEERSGEGLRRKERGEERDGGGPEEEGERESKVNPRRILRNKSY